MCGIVGLFCKSPELEPRLGEHLVGDARRRWATAGPDSAGVAVYRDPAPAGLDEADAVLAPIPARTGARSRRLARRSAATSDSTCARGTRSSLVEARRRRGARRGCARRRPELRVMSAGQRDRDLQGGRPAERVRRALRARTTSRARTALGHTRMATESRVTTEGSHPFSTGLDLCLVHNGSLSNHNRLRESLRREGIEFQTENDTEVAAGYLDVAAARGRDARAGARGLPRRPRRLLHLPRRHGRRLRRAARPDRLQAGGAGRDRRLGRDGVRVPRDRRAARRRRRADLGAGAGVVYAWEKALV